MVVGAGMWAGDAGASCHGVLCWLFGWVRGMGEVHGGPAARQTHCCAASAAAIWTAEACRQSMIHIRRGGRWRWSVGRVVSKGWGQCGQEWMGGCGRHAGAARLLRVPMLQQAGAPCMLPVMGGATASCTALGPCESREGAQLQTQLAGLRSRVWRRRGRRRRRRSRHLCSRRRAGGPLRRRAAAVGVGILLGLAAAACFRWRRGRRRRSSGGGRVAAAAAMRRLPCATAALVRLVAGAHLPPAALLLHWVEAGGGVEGVGAVAAHGGHAARVHAGTPHAHAAIPSAALQGWGEHGGIGMVCCVPLGVPLGTALVSLGMQQRAPMLRAGAQSSPALLRAPAAASCRTRPRASAAAGAASSAGAAS